MQLISTFKQLTTYITHHDLSHPVINYSETCCSSGKIGDDPYPIKNYILGVVLLGVASWPLGHGHGIEANFVRSFAVGDLSREVSLLGG